MVLPSEGKGITEWIVDLVFEWVHGECVACVSIDVNVNVMHSMHCRDRWRHRAVSCAKPLLLCIQHHTMANTYTISDLAKEFDLTTRAIRFYEDMGLLQPERTGICGAQSRLQRAGPHSSAPDACVPSAWGCHLTEAKEIIDLYDSPRDTGVQLRKFLDVLVVHRKQLEEQMADLAGPIWRRSSEHEEEARCAAGARVETEK